ncbi:MAG: family 20 glycosylhydrolase, partial [Balneolaceae bacterium]|nr:family 20 glycosylhydrolase [Balneolaceae bacterium]
MISRVITFFVTLLLIYTGFASGQTGPQFHPENLHVSWKLLDNHYQEQSQYRAEIQLTNSGDQPLPADGWSMYMNNMFGEDQNGYFETEHVNGDLVRLHPTSTLNGLPPGNSVTLEIVGPGSILNISGDPIGIYWVWDEDQQHGIPITRYSVKPVDGPEVLDRGPDDHVPVATPEIEFTRNKDIDHIAEESLIPVFPTPEHYSKKASKFELTPNTPVQYQPAFRSEAEYLSEELARVFGVRLPLTTEPVDGPKIALRSGNSSPEGYELSVSPNTIAISAAEPAGIFYGIQSLKTALPPHSWEKEHNVIPVPAMEVEDAPRFGHRALMQDVSRNFRSKEQILKTLDLMALYKLNVFHFHFNDDEGWRIEIPGLPELTNVGGKRGHTQTNLDRLQPSYGSGPHSTYPGSGYYSTEDIIEILENATERHIRVIPEIETPGHARAAIKAMDARYRYYMERGEQEAAWQYLLQHPEDSSEYRSVQGWDDNV